MPEVCFPTREARHRVELQALSTTPDGQGGVTSAWVTYATVYAKVVPVRGRKLWAARQAQSELSHEVTIRYRSDVSTAHRVVYSGAAEPLAIRAVVDVDYRHVVLVLDCLEGSPDVTDG